MSLTTTPKEIKTAVDGRGFYEGLRFRIGNTVYRLGSKDIVALRNLQLIRLGMPDKAKPGWLLHYRPQIQLIRSLRPKAALSLLVATAIDPQTRSLAVWLRGLCGGTLAAPQLLRIALRSSLNEQALFARAFQRMGAWSQIRELAKIPELAEGHSRFLRDRVPRPFSNRLERYLSHVPRLETSGRAPSLVCDEDAGTRIGKPAKPLWLIRLVLDRIRLLVSAERSCDRWPEPFLDRRT